MDKFRGVSPGAWLLVFAAAAPWVRVEWAPFVAYPGHWAVSLALAAVLLRDGAPRQGARVPLKSGLLLGLYVCLMAALRQQWEVLAAAAAAVGLCYPWGAAAYRLGRAPAGSGAAGDGLVLLLAATLPVGLAGWAATAAAPAACRVLNCPRSAGTPYVFQGGWNGSAQFFLLLALVLPVAGAYLIQLNRERRRRGPRNVLAAVLAGCGIGLLAGAPLWVLGLLGLTLAWGAWRLRAEALPEDGRLVKGAVAVAALAALVIYGLFPAYLTVAAGGGGERGEVRIEQVALPEDGLTSDHPASVTLRITNAGLVTLPGGPGRTLWLRPRLLITPQRGRTRAYDGDRVRLDGALAPGRSREVTLPVRLPHWAREGFLAWRVENGDGGSLALAEGSDLGFRFVNRGYRALERAEANRLSALAARARDFGAFTFVPAGRERFPHGAESLVGETLDTLFFSPLWGLAAGREAKALPFATPRPFWAQLFQEYGAIGLVLGGVFAWRLIRRARRIGARGFRSPARLGWQLVPVAATAAVAAGLFSPVLGSYHAVWGLFLLSGYVEGKHDQWFALPAPLQAKRPAFWPWRRQGWRQRRYKPLRRRRIHR